MNLRQYIKTYTTFGGSWHHLEKYLIQAGMGNDFASYYVSHIRTTLGKEHSEKAILIYDLWLKCKDDDTAKASMILLGI